MIFGDSSYFVGLADAKDQWHNRAVSLRPQLKDTLVVSELVVSEALTIVGSRGGGRPANALYQFFKESCDLVFLSPSQLDSAAGYQLRYDGVLSLADCASLVIMSSHGIRQIASFDSDFDRVKGIERLH